jgi:hypothetical protein
MNLYTAIGARVNTAAARALSQRLAAWHDALVAHERQMAGRMAAICDDDCPHAEASALWNDALVTFGQHAHELSLLRARGLAAAA